MSGQPKPTEAEALKQLIREAHEAMKDLRLAIKEIRAERAEHADFLDQTLKLAAAAGVEQIGREAQKGLDFIQAEADRMLRHISELIGAHSTEDLVDAIVQEGARSLATQLTLAADEDGNLVIGRRPPAQVFVTTDPALAPPGSIILDAR